ncbi:response regulator [Flavobacterium sp. PL12]|uniref:response regulator n=1 Tax=Flavobacterium sp. PL12 TaxID=3071718 RepID=UPI00319DCCC3
MNDELKVKFEKVMLIDDNRTDLYIASRIIIKNKFAAEVLEHTSARDALIYLQNNQENSQLLPQVIFVDIYMPLMSGFDFVAEYSKFSSILKESCQVHIISSTIDDVDILRARKEQNVMSFHIKPITKEILARITSSDFKKI